MPDFLLCESAAADEVARACAERPGARVITVHRAGDAAEAVLAALAGDDLVIVAAGSPEVIDAMCDDLRTLGTLCFGAGTGPPPETAGDRLDDDQRALLRELLQGHTLGEAARRLHISRRTADRRLAAAKRALGASSTSAALVIAARRGIGAPPGR